MDSQTLNSMFQQGNTTLYTSSLPTNGQSVNYISEQDYDAGKGYAISVRYDVNAQVVTPAAATLSGDNGRVSVAMMQKSAFTDPDVGALSSTTDETQPLDILLNPAFDFAVKPFTPQDVIAHELGFHNMMGLLHQPDSNGQPIYPGVGAPAQLEQNTTGKVVPSIQDTRQIINNNLPKGRLETVK